MQSGCPIKNYTSNETDSNIQTPKESTKYQDEESVTVLTRTTSDPPLKPSNEEENSEESV